MNEVWGHPETEKQELDDFEDSFRTFFMKHKVIRQVILSPSIGLCLFHVKR
jgi:hypothetical protein